ncbi:MAG: DUF4136 domain-containing protein [Myxococcales bacterium]|nr:DUF4136 domain-containing protein [Myxococcales bacterium]
MRRSIGLSVLLLACACANPSVFARKTVAYADDTYRSISLGESPAPGGFERQRLPESLEEKAWSVMQSRLQGKDWEFRSMQGTELLVYFGLGPAPDAREDDVPPGTFFVDVFERRSGRRVWYGYAEGLTPLTEQNIEQALDQMLLRFPETPPSPVAY